MAILVTGGAGYIGSHTCIELLQAGYEVIIVDNFTNSKKETLNQISEITKQSLTCYEADLLNKEEIDSIFNENPIDAVIHLAGLKAVGESVAKPLHYYKNNLVATLNLCETMNNNQVKHLVFSSSATVYGNPTTIPISEDTSLNPTNPYGRTKMMIEEMLRDLAASDSDWSIALLRYFNPIGAHESGQIGENPNGIPNNLMPYITQTAAGKLPKLHIFGNDYPTKDGTGVRDYIHVVDLAKGHLAALEKVQQSRGIEAYNLGTGRGYSVLEIINAFKKTTGVKVPYEITDRRPGDVAASFADIQKATTQLHWKADKNIEDMCRDAWRWEQTHRSALQVSGQNR